MGKGIKRKTGKKGPRSNMIQTPGLEILASIIAGAHLKRKLNQNLGKSDHPYPSIEKGIGT
jgi:hypothetical protein